MDEPKYKIGDIVFANNTIQNYVGVVVDVMISSWGGQLMYSVYSLDKKDWVGTFSQEYIAPYTPTYQKQRQYLLSDTSINHLDDAEIENRLKEFADSKTSDVVDKDFAKEILAYIMLWKQCCVTIKELAKKSNERADKK